MADLSADYVYLPADIVYMVTGGSSLHQAYKLFGGTQSFGLSAWIVVFAATELLSCQVSPIGSMPHLSYQRFVSGTLLWLRFPQPTITT